MYKVTSKVPKMYDRLGHGDPLVCLEDEYGGQAVIHIDDHCFVLSLGSSNSPTRKFKISSHWFKEAALALKEFLENNHYFKM